MAPPPCPGPRRRVATCPRSSRSASQGVTMKATPSEASIATDAPTGMGRMYGPISPDTNAIGRIAAMTVNVARIVGLPTSSTPRPPPPRACGRPSQVAVDVLDHDDRVVDQDADREDQREQRDAVERVAHRVVDEQRERERDRHGDQHHQRLAPAQEEARSAASRTGGDQQVEDQLVGLLRRRLAVVARHRPPRRRPAAAVRAPARRAPARRAPPWSRWRPAAWRRERHGLLRRAAAACALT
jgi:hypothetical protein